MDKLTINPNRISLDEAYMQMAEIWAQRSKANRLQVGGLLVLDNQIISDGYNGMPSGYEGDDEVCECYDDEGNIITKNEVLHCEANMLMKVAANGGTGTKGATMYVTHSPCPHCAKIIIQSKVARVVYRHKYRLAEGLNLLEKRGIQCYHLIKAPQKNPCICNPVSDACRNPLCYAAVP
ncbi:deoxycytidylate deaminase [Acinetobacter sp.]|uniref:deoxycytidylate deaminase n=1 Tax=Acinetobacter sp. TaxID=472 RepID=UPI00388EE0F5